MNKIIGFLGTYLCYYLGCIFGFLAYNIEFEWLYIWYCNLMEWSSKIQDWAGLEGPWKEPKK